MNHDGFDGSTIPIQPDTPPALPPQSASLKKQLRRSLLQVRQSLPQEVWHAGSNRICAHLQTSIWMQQASTVLIYSSFRQEPDLSALWGLPYRWGLPRCVGQALSWHLWVPDASPSLQPGAYGILEPTADAPILRAEEVDLILVPTLGADRRGYRLGYGGGFYDRLLSDPAWAEIPTIGIMFEFAWLPQLPVEAWDQPLQAICTEAGLFTPTC